MTQNAQFHSLQRAWWEVAGNVPNLLSEIRCLLSTRTSRSRRMVVQEVHDFFDTVAFGVATGGELEGGWDACAALLRERIEDRLTNQYAGEFLPDLAQQLYAGYQPASSKDGSNVG